MELYEIKQKSPLSDQTVSLLSLIHHNDEIFKKKISQRKTNPKDYYRTKKKFIFSLRVI